MDFKEQLKSAVDIVNVIGEYVRLKKAGANVYKGLCPFHTEKTPSFNVHAARQFFKCFGCGEGGDVFSFVQKIEGVTFYEALKLLAERNGIPLPKRSLVADDESKLRESVFQMHDLAQENFRANLQGPSGEMARAYLARRGVAPATVERFGLGYADRSGRALLRLLEQRRIEPPQIEQSGLVRKREDGSAYDYFRNRLMFPIHNESGKIIGFGGRALAPDDNPKYLNSPETPIYTKSRVLYNLHRAKEAIRKEGRAILVEGYMDAIGVSAAGFAAVVASCGTSLTEHQVKMLKRHSERIVVNFDPDAPGAAAAGRSIQLLLEQGMYVRIMELDGDLDPDEYCKERGAGAYGARLNAARGYFHWLADRARAKHDMRTTEGRIAVLKFLMPAIERIADRLERMTVANDVAEYIGVDRGMVLDSFRKAVAERKESRIEGPKETVRADERGILNVLLSDTPGREELIPDLKEVGILDRLATRRIFQAVMAAHAGGAAVTFDAVSARLAPEDQNLLAELALAEGSEAHETTLSYGRQCLESLQRSGEQARRAQLKGKIKEAERAGNLAEALRLAGELQRLERAGEAAR
ncbi:MAG: DNA primase [Acidobacteriia bacterium]|nr:DNA primase [Terriglobia bacterium]